MRVVADHRPAARTATPESAALYDAMQELVRIYQFRDRDTACYGDVSPNECYALEAIERADGPTLNEVAAALGLHKSNASRIVEGLVRKGYVTRRTDLADRRAVRLAVTPGGAEVHATIRRRIEKRYATLLAPLSAATRRRLVALVRALGVEAGARIGCAGGATTKMGGGACS